MELDIPPYQRPYTWSVKNVGELIDDIRRFRRAGHYRIGTFILHESSTEQAAIWSPETVRSGRGSRLDIVDGQQRYLSFALIAHALMSRSPAMEDNLAHELRTFVAGITIPQRADGRSEKSLQGNYRYLVEQMVDWSDEELNDFTEFFLRGCSVVVLQVRELDAAFQMFDSQNTRGRPLYPTDLLKAYHLREFSRTNPSRESLLETVRRWEAIPPEEINHVIAAVLFPIKRWSVNHRVPHGGFTAHYVELFKGVREDIEGNGRYRWAHPVLLAKATVDRFQAENQTLLRHGVLEELEFPFQIVQPVIDGEMFFRMVEHYVKQARRAGINGPAAPSRDRLYDRDAKLDRVLEILDAMPAGTGNRYVRELFDCLLIAYVDRFGWFEVETAALVLARYAYLLRVYLRRVQISSVDMHARTGHPRVQDVTGNPFADIASALDPRSILTGSGPRVLDIASLPTPLQRLYMTTKPGLGEVSA